MQSPSFNEQFRAIALERVEHIRLKYHKTETFQKFAEWQENIHLIESFLPKEQQHLTARLKDIMLQMIDEYDVQIFKQGFVDGILFYKDILENTSKDQ